MNKEFEPGNLELLDLADRVMDTFIQRRDLYARQLAHGSYICIKKPITQKHVIAHLEGELTLGAYILNYESQAKYIVFDADDSLQFVKLAHIRNILDAANRPSYLESSRRGGHLWIFFSQSISGESARKLGLELQKKFKIDDIELFPKQDNLKTGPGSLIRLPFGIHRRTGKRYGFLSQDFLPLADNPTDQIKILTNPHTIPMEIIEKIITKQKRKTNPDPIKTHDKHEDTMLSTRIKQSVSAIDFISRYVDLTKNGHGKCPFHDDQVNSFAVNSEDNYWHCFAGCGGGSVIDFWMKYRKCDFTTAVREMKTMVLIRK